MHVAVGSEYAPFLSKTAVKTIGSGVSDHFNQATLK